MPSASCSGIPAVLYRRTEKKRITLHVDPNCSSCSRIWCGGEAIRPSVTEDEAIRQSSSQTEGLMRNTSW